MNFVANENEVSEENALFGIIVDEPAKTASVADDVKTPVPLEISWHVAPVQNVAILDLSEKAASNDFSPLTPTGPVTTAAQPEPQKYKYL